MELKNIKILKIKIYKIEPEAYYLKQLKEIDDDFDLDGFIPNEEKTLEFNEPSMKKFEREVEFSNITSEENGIFFIDFIGGGLSARAIIRKGKIYLKKFNTIVGHSIIIYNENNQAFKKGKLGIWVNNNFYKRDKNGEIIIPYGKTCKNEKIVISVGNNAYLEEMEILTENFEFECKVIYSNESLISNNKANFYIQPQ